MDCCALPVWQDLVSWQRCVVKVEEDRVEEEEEKEDQEDVAKGEGRGREGGESGQWRDGKRVQGFCFITQILHI